MTHKVRLRVAWVGSTFDECWHRGANYQLTYDDWSHPDTLGAYLTSAFFFEMITGRRSQGVPYAGGLDAAAADYLRGLAHQFGGSHWTQTSPEMNFQLPHTPAKL